MNRPLCRHCHKGNVIRPRGLCWKCYYADGGGIRDLYPSTSKFARRGVRDTAGPRPLPDEPTDALPGTPEKEAVMTERAAKGQSLWHPRDPRICRDRPADGRVPGLVAIRRSNRQAHLLRFLSEPLG